MSDRASTSEVQPGQAALDTSAGKPQGGLDTLNPYDLLKSFAEYKTSFSFSSPSSACLPDLEISSRSPCGLVGDSQWHQYGNNGNDATAPKLTNESDGSVTITADDKTNGGISRAIEHQFDDADGTAVHLEYLAKSPQKLGMTVSILEGHAPYDAALSEHVQPSEHQDATDKAEGWTRYDCDLVVPKAKAGELQLHIVPDKGNGEIQVKDLHLTENQPLQAQLKHEVDPNVVEQNIEQNHTEQVKYKVVGPDGKPIPGAQLSVDQTTRPTEFGVEVEHLAPTDHSDEQENYEANLAKGFNAVTISVYGGMMEKNGEFKPDAVKAIQKQIDWAHNHGKQVRLHPLVWDHCLPKGTSDDPQQAWGQQLESAKKLMKQFKGVDEFIGFNEAFNNQDNGVSHYIAENRAEAVEQAMDTEHSAEPKSTFIYNDYKNNDEEIALLRQMQKDGKLPDAIGVQLHMHQGQMPLEQVQYFMDQLKQFNRPVYTTEITVLSGDPRQVSDGAGPAKDWNTTEAGEKEQADYLQRLYKQLYSNDEEKGISYWDLSDTQKKDKYHHGAWKGAPGGLLEKNGTPKPGFNTVDQLINHEWTTRESVTTDESGAAEVQSQLGDYNLSVPGYSINEIDGGSANNGDGTVEIGEPNHTKTVTIHVTQKQ